MVFWATFSHNKYFCRGLGLVLYRKQTTRNLPQRNFPYTPWSSFLAFSCLEPYSFLVRANAPFPALAPPPRCRMTTRSPFWKTYGFRSRRYAGWWIATSSCSRIEWRIDRSIFYLVVLRIIVFCCCRRRCSRCCCCLDSLCLILIGLFWLILRRFCFREGERKNSVDTSMDLFVNLFTGR